MDEKQNTLVSRSLTSASWKKQSRESYQRKFEVID
jgi:hypothetical protein